MDYKRIFDSGSKFSLVYALQEADCDRNKLRYRSQTWVIRNGSEEDQLLTDTSVKKWRNLKANRLRRFCTPSYAPMFGKRKTSD